MSGTENDLNIDNLDISFESNATEVNYNAEELLPSITPLELSNNFTYPALLLRNVYFEDVLHILKTIKRAGSFREMPLWIEIDSGAEQVGNIQLDSDFLLTARYIGLRVTLFASENNIQEIDLRDPTVIAKYV